MLMNRSGRAALLLVSLLAMLVTFGVACSSDDVVVVAPSFSLPAEVTDVFAGTLDRGGSSFFSFSASTVGVGRITLASVSQAAVGEALPTVLGLGFGVPRGTGCTVTQSLSASAALSAQIVSAVTPDIYCVQVSDLGTLTGPVNFTIRIVHP
jgi:hypothetical protein